MFKKKENLQSAPIMSFCIPTPILELENDRLHYDSQLLSGLDNSGSHPKLSVEMEMSKSRANSTPVSEDSSEIQSTLVHINPKSQIP